MNSHNHAIESSIKEDPTTSERTDVIRELLGTEVPSFLNQPPQRKLSSQS